MTATLNHQDADHQELALRAVVDCPEWAWTEIAADIVRDADDAEFYGEYTALVDAAGARLLRPILRRAWQERGANLVAFVSKDEFPQWQGDELGYFEVWDRAADQIEFDDVVREADLMTEWRAR